MTDTQTIDPDEHDALNCPQCQAFSETAKIVGGMAETMDRMIHDGTFERMGREMALRQNEAVMKAILN